MTSKAVVAREGQVVLGSEVGPLAFARDVASTGPLRMPLSLAMARPALPGPALPGPPPTDNSPSTAPTALPVAAVPSVLFPRLATLR